MKNNDFEKWVNENFSKARIEEFIKKYKNNYMSSCWSEILEVGGGEFDPLIYMEELDRCHYDCKYNGTDLWQLEKFFNYPIA